MTPSVEPEFDLIDDALFADGKLYYSQCLFYALDRWHAEGGSLVFVKSTHWLIPHVQHQSRAGVLTHFVPPEDLRAVWHSLFGFYGTVVTGDQDERTPISMTGIFIGWVLMGIFGAAWAINRNVAKLLKGLT